MSGFAVPASQHVTHTPPAPLPAALLAVKFVYVREDASVPPLASLYRSPYLILERRTKLFCLQLGDRMDIVSVDKLKPAFSDEPISPALPPLRGCLPLPPVLIPQLLLLMLELLGARKLLALTFLLGFLLNGTFMVLHVREGSAPRSFWGEYCGESTTTLPSSRSCFPHTTTTQDYMCMIA